MWTSQGTARNVSFNIIRAEFRKGWDKPELLTPGKIEKYEMEMYFYGMVFKKGHKIRIDISSSELMEAFPNTNTGIDPYTDRSPSRPPRPFTMAGNTPLMSSSLSFTACKQLHVIFLYASKKMGNFMRRCCEKSKEKPKSGGENDTIILSAAFQTFPHVGQAVSPPGKANK